jgi:hypothetical protein
MLKNVFPNVPEIAARTDNDKLCGFVTLCVGVLLSSESV